MNALNMMVIICSMLMTPSYSFSMGSSSGSLISYEENMAQFSRSLDELAEKLTDMSKERIQYRGVSRERSECDIPLAHITQLRTYMTHLRGSLDTTRSREQHLVETDVLREVRAVFDHLDERLVFANNLLVKYSSTSSVERRKLLNNVLDPLTEIQENLNGLFGICDKVRYVSSREDIIKVLLEKARSFSLERIAGLFVSVASQGVVMSVGNDIQGSSSWSDQLHKKVHEYKQSYDNRARTVVDHARVNPQHITNVLADLSHRLCGPQFCAATNENLELIKKLCLRCVELSPTLQEMQKDNSLSAKNLALVLKAALPRVLTAGRILASVESVAKSASQSTDGVSSQLKKMASQAVLDGIVTTGLASKKEIDSIAKNATKETPLSKHMDKITRIIQDFHLEFAVPTIVASLQNFDSTLTIAMRRAADVCIASDSDCKEVLKIVYDLKGENTASIRKENEPLLMFLKRLQYAWNTRNAQRVIFLSVNPGESWETASDDGLIYSDADDGLAVVGSSGGSGSDGEEKSIKNEDDEDGFELKREYDQDFLDLIYTSGDNQGSYTDDIS